MSDTSKILNIRRGRMKRHDDGGIFLHEEKTPLTAGFVYGPIRAGDVLAVDGGREEWEVEEVCGTLQVKRCERETSGRWVRRIRPIQVLVGEIVELRT